MDPGRVMVTGILCRHGHFGDPRALFCVYCGVSMVNGTPTPVLGPRPPLGILLTDDGVSVSLDGDYVIGGAPGADPLVASGRARPLVLEDGDGMMAPVQARVLLQDWDVRLADHGTSRRASVLLPAAEAWEVLPPGEATTISSGTRIRLGGRELLYDSYHLASRPRRRVAASK
jgi:hypothetical protein